MMPVQLLTQDAALAALRPAWQALWQQVPDASPFLSPAWLLPWWQVFGNGRLRAAVLPAADGSLLGLLPLYRLGEKLLPLGAGLTDYLDALVAPQAPPDAATRLLQAAMAGQDCRCDLPDLPPAAALLRAAPPPGWRWEGWQAADAPVLALSQELPANTRRKLRMARHRTDRSIGDWSVRQHDTPAPWPELLRLHAQCWAARDEPGGVLADARVQRFHALALPQLAALGALRFHALYHGAAAAAVCYTLLARPAAVYCYLSGFDPAQRYTSPGSLLLGEIIAAARAEGRQELHFLRGEEAYKYAFGATPRRNAGRSLVPA